MSDYTADKRLREYEESGLLLEGAERLYCSVNGNPRFRIIFRKDGSLISHSFMAITQTDGSVSYDVTNYLHSRYEGKTFTVVFSRAGRVVAINPES